MTAALIITTAVKAFRSSRSDTQASWFRFWKISYWRGVGEGTITTDALLAYSAVCGTGLDTIPFPGDIGVDQLARILAMSRRLHGSGISPYRRVCKPSRERRPASVQSLAAPSCSTLRCTKSVRMIFTRTCRSHSAATLEQAADGLDSHGNEVQPRSARPTLDQPAEI